MAQRTESGAIFDLARERRVPFKAYWPENATGARPVVIFSHGLGGSRNAARYLGMALAGAGFVSIHIQHEGTDASVYRGLRGRADIEAALHVAARSPRNAVNRYKDVPFVLDELARRNGVGPWKGTLDLMRIGMAGHSYGARGVLVAAGERVGRRYTSYLDARIRAGVVLSSSVPAIPPDATRAFADITIPLLHVTGTKDKGPFSWLSDIVPETRLGPYRTVPADNQYLLVLKDADHGTFSGNRLGRRREKPLDRAHTDAVARAAVLFFKAYLLDDTDALKRLRTDFPKTLSAGDRFEWR